MKALSTLRFVAVRGTGSIFATRQLVVLSYIECCWGDIIAVERLLKVRHVFPSPDKASGKSIAARDRPSRS